jgi:branched-chain amino acid transport system substrate-binding protein
MRRTTLRCILGMLGMLFAGLAMAQAPIRVGSVLSLTGPAAFLGDPELKTLQLYVERINGGGGVLGRKLELVHYDDGSDASKANTFAKRLIEQDKVNFIVGGTTTGSTMAMAPLVERAKVPFISLAGGVAIVEPVKKWVFKTPHTDRMAAEKVFEDMKKRGIAKVGLLSETSGFGQSGRKETQAVAAKYGVTLVGDETYGPKDTDMTAQLTKLRGAPGVQAIFVFGLGQGPAIVTKNYRQLGIEVPLYHAHGVASDEFIRLAGTAAEGVRLPAAALIVAKQLADNDPQKPVVTAYEKAYRERYKEDVSTFGGHAYDGLMMLTDAIKRAGGTDREKVRDALEATKGYMGTGGLVNMSSTDHMGLDLTAFRMVEIRNGDWTLAK